MEPSPPGSPPPAEPKLVTVPLTGARKALASLIKGLKLGIVRAGFIGWAVVGVAVFVLVDLTVVAPYGALVLATGVLAEATGLLAAASVYNAENARRTNESVVSAIRASLGVRPPPGPETEKDSPQARGGAPPTPPTP